MNWNWVTIYGILKYWAPIIAALSFAVKGFNVAGRGLSRWANHWADTLINNHVHTIETSIKGMADSVSSMVEYQKQQAVTLEKVNLGIEILKDRTGVK